MAASTSAFAQEESEPAVIDYKDANQNTDVVNADDKSAVERGAPRQRDSTHLRAVILPIQKTKSNDQSKPSSNKEDDALSFNFLYYIIQKFKISDLVDN